MSDEQPHQPSDELESLRSAAYHEAGHAVIAFSSGFLVSGAKVIVGADRCSAAGCEGADGAFLPGRMLCSPPTACKIFHAGHVAQEKYAGQPPDRERWRSDRDEMRKCLLLYDFGEDDWEEESERWLPKTRQIVEYYWSAIRAVAEELAEQQELNDAQVVDLVAPIMDRRA